MKWNKIILKNFRMFQCFILSWNHVWNKTILAAKIILFHFSRGYMLKLNTKILWNNFILTRNHGLSRHTVGGLGR